MKKRFTTLLLGLGAFAFLNAQVLFNNDTKKIISSAGGWNTTKVVKLNPVKTVNTTDSAMMITTTGDNWGLSMFTFDSVVMGTYNAIEMMVLSTTDSAQMVLAEGNLNGNLVLNSNPTNKALLKNTWYKWSLTVTGATATTYIKQLQLKFKSINANSPTNLYIDEIKLTNFTYVPPMLEPKKILNAMYVKDADIKMDGDAKEDFYEEVEWHLIDSVNSNSGKLKDPTKPTSNNLTAMWNETYLYLYVDMLGDDNLLTWDNANGFWAGWSGDACQTYIDVKDRHADGMKYGEFSGFSIYPGGETLEAQAKANKSFRYELRAMGADTTLAKQGSVTKTDGYSIEIALPWHGLCQGAMPAGEIDAFVAAIKAGTRIAFDIQLNDATLLKATDRENMISWCSRPLEPYGNSGTWGSIVLKGTSGIPTTTSVNVSVYPNPTTGIVNFENVTSTSVEIMNLAGQVVMTSEIINNQINISQLPNGIYFAKVGEISVVKLIKQ